MWEKDKLNRRMYAEFLSTLIKNSEKYKRSEKEESYVIALDSGWGTGKTYFLELMEEYLKQEQEMHVIHYSAWENDFWDNAFIPLLYALYHSDSLKNGMRKEEGKKYGKEILLLALCLGRAFSQKKLEAFLGEEGVKVLENGLDHWEENPAESVTDVFQGYEDFQKALEKIRQMLRELLRKENGEKKVLVVIDELDRCRPDFAVQTLEVVKHLFNVDGLVFLFAVDLEQLGCVVRGIYGESLDARTYLNRMFHYITHLPDADAGDYFKILYQEKKENFQEEHQKAEYETGLADCIRGLAAGFRLSLRELDTIWKNYLVLYDYKLKDYRRTEAHQLYLIFLVLKYKIPDLGRYLKERELDSLNQMKELDMCRGSLSVDSPLSELFRQSVAQPLERMKGWVYGPNAGPAGKREIDLMEADGIRLIFTENNGWGKIQIHSESCFAGILYAPDFSGWEYFKNLTIVEYMKKQLELFTFDGEQANDQR